jgi:HSP20 family protein
MAETKVLEPQKEEIEIIEGTERTREGLCFIPRADIYELDDHLVILADIPGADEKTIDIVLEKDVLTINAYVDPVLPEGYSLAYAEYEVGDYTRSFKITSEIDREKISASVKNGVLRLQLPKAAAARTRKIAVTTA